jgi:hypothetical protein
MLGLASHFAILTDESLAEFDCAFVGGCSQASGVNGGRGCHPIRDPWRADRKVHSKEENNA